MKRILYLLFLLIFITAPVFSQNATDAKGRKQGAWTKSFPSGKMRYTGSFVDDKPTGDFTYYYENGKVKAKNYFYNGGGRSRVTLFSIEGYKEAEGTYDGQLKDSAWVYFNKNGKAIAKEHYLSGKKNGAFETLSPDGSHTEEITHWSIDIKNGPWLQLFSNGNKRIEAHYKKGELDSLFKVFFPEGRIKMEGKYRNASKHGEWLEYNSDGSLRQQEIYKNGTLIKTTPLNGVFKTTFPNGMPETEYTYRGGKKNGPFFEYYNSGRLVKQNRQNEEGVMEIYEMPEGIMVKRKGVYKDNELLGKVESFDVKGSPMKEDPTPSNGGNKKGE
jgi:antitoxin component YwqK of YwqJK toxin-antitoxin module